MKQYILSDVLLFIAFCMLLDNVCYLMFPSYLILCMPWNQVFHVVPIILSGICQILHSKGRV